MSIEAGAGARNKNGDPKPPVGDHAWQRIVKGKAAGWHGEAGRGEVDALPKREKTPKAKEPEPTTTTEPPQGGPYRERPLTVAEQLEEKLKQLKAKVHNNEIHADLMAAERLFEDLKRDHSEEEVAAYDQKLKITEGLEVARHLANIYDQLEVWKADPEQQAHPSDNAKDPAGLHQKAELSLQESREFSKKYEAALKHLDEVYHGRSDKNDQEAQETKGLEGDDLTLSHRERLGFLEKKVRERLKTATGREPTQEEFDRVVYNVNGTPSPLSKPKRVGQFLKRLGESTLGKVFDTFADTSIQEAVSQYRALEDEGLKASETVQSLMAEKARREAYAQHLQEQVKNLEKIRTDREAREAREKALKEMKPEPLDKGAALKRQKNIEQKRRILARDQLAIEKQDQSAEYKTEIAKAKRSKDKAKVKELEAARKDHLTNALKRDEAAVEVLNSAREIKDRIQKWRDTQRDLQSSGKDSIDPNSEEGIAKEREIHKQVTEERAIDLFYKQGYAFEKVLEAFEKAADKKIQTEEDVEASAKEILHSIEKRTLKDEEILHALLEFGSSQNDTWIKQSEEATGELQKEAIKKLLIIDKLNALLQQKQIEPGQSWPTLNEAVRRFLIKQLEDDKPNEELAQQEGEAKAVAQAPEEELVIPLTRKKEGGKKQSPDKLPQKSVKRYFGEARYNKMREKLVRTLLQDYSARENIEEYLKKTGTSQATALTDLVSRYLSDYALWHNSRSKNTDKAEEPSAYIREINKLLALSSELFEYPTDKPAEEVKSIVEDQPSKPVSNTTDEPTEGQPEQPPISTKAADTAISGTEEDKAGAQASKEFVDALLAADKEEERRAEQKRTRPKKAEVGTRVSEQDLDGLLEADKSKAESLLEDVKNGAGDQEDLPSLAQSKKSHEEDYDANLERRKDVEISASDAADPSLEEEPIIPPTIEEWREEFQRKLDTPSQDSVKKYFGEKSYDKIRSGLLETMEKAFKNTDTAEKTRSLLGMSADSKIEDLANKYLSNYALWYALGDETSKRARDLTTNFKDLDTQLKISYEKLEKPIDESTPPKEIQDIVRKIKREEQRSRGASDTTNKPIEGQAQQPPTPTEPEKIEGTGKKGRTGARELKDLDINLDDLAEVDNNEDNDGPNLEMGKEEVEIDAIEDDSSLEQEQAIKEEALSVIRDVAKAAMNLPKNLSDRERAKEIKAELDKIPLTERDWKEEPRKSVLEQLKQQRDSSLAALEQGQLNEEAQATLREQIAILNDLLELLPRSTKRQEAYVKNRQNKAGELAISQIGAEKRQARELTRAVESKLAGEISVILKNLPEEILRSPTPSEIYLHAYQALKGSPSLQSIYALQEEWRRDKTKESSESLQASNETLLSAFSTASGAIQARIPALERLAGRDADAQDRLNTARRLPSVVEKLLTQSPESQRSIVTKAVQEEYANLTEEFLSTSKLLAQAPEITSVEEKIESISLGRKNTSLQETMAVIEQLADDIGIELGPARKKANREAPIAGISDMAAE